MQTTGPYDPNGYQAIVNALRGPQGVQMAGDVVPLPFTEMGGDWTKAGPAAPNPIAMHEKIANAPLAARSGLSFMPPKMWGDYMARLQARPTAMPPPLPPTLGGPWPPGSGGNLPPKM